VVAVGLADTTSDVDLFVTMFDGRFPTSIDFDFQSTNQGADDILIKYNDPFFTSSNYNTSNGMLFMVGVKALTPNANYTLVMNGPVRLSADFFTLVNGVQQQKQFSYNNRTHYYKWFNWGGKDLRINVDVTKGNVSAYLNFFSELDYQSNVYIAFPQSSGNARWSTHLNYTSDIFANSDVIKVLKS
jgi:hypothetical protein